MKLRIKRRTQTGWLMRLLLLMPFLQFWLPSGVKFAADGAWVLLVIYLLRFRKNLDWAKLGCLPGWVLAFLGLCLAVYLVKYQSGLYFLWGLRNQFRFYGAFFAFALFLTPEDLEDYRRTFDRLFWLDVLVSLVQFYGFGLKGDRLGGLFGYRQGCNGYTNLFFALVVTEAVVFCLERKERPACCVVKCIAALYVAALAELKFYFVEFLLILVLVVLLTDFSWRKVGILLVGCAAAVAFAALIDKLFPKFEGWFSLKWLLETAASEKGYASAGDLNRLTAVSGINRRVFRTWGQRVFGLGLGNCEYSGWAAMTTPFYRRFSYLHYTWMSVAFVYLETGYLGLAFFFGFFFLVYRRRGQSGWCRVGKIMAVLCALIAVYNSSLRTEAGYLACFALAAPFASDRRML